MSNLAESREEVELEDVEFGAGVSEALATKFGQIANFISRRQTTAFDFKFFGPFRPISGGEDGTRGFINDCDIVGITGYIKTSGTSGNTIIDIHWLTNETDNGTIFSTKITIANTAADGATFGVNLLDSSSNASTGVTLPVFSKTEFDKFDTLRVDVDSNASGAFDLVINVHYRPR